MTRAQQLLDWFWRELPHLHEGIQEARAVDPDRFDRLAETFLGWAEGVLGDKTLDTVGHSYAQFTTSVNFHQSRYELAGSYEATSQDEFLDVLYNSPERMTDYLWGVYLTLFAWPHHLTLAKLYEETFLPRIKPGDHIIELAFGHGGWGLWALSATTDTQLTGVDISPSSVKMASSLAQASGLSQRTSYSQGDALVTPTAATAQVGICGFVIEHLSEPHKLLEALAGHIEPGGWLFLTGALTAAQEDHIFEFLRESEIMMMAEKAGFRVTETISAGPPRTFPKARFLPRSMALIMQRCRQDTW